MNRPALGSTDRFTRDTPGSVAWWVMMADLSGGCRLDEATAITNSVESVEGAVASPWPEGTTEILHARIALWRRAGSTTRTRWPSRP